MKIKEFQYDRITFPLGTVIISNYYLVWISYWKVGHIFSLNKMSYLTEETQEKCNLKYAEFGYNWKDYIQLTK